MNCYPPILFRTYYGSAWEERGKLGEKYFYGYEKKNEQSWKTFIDGVKDATGKEFVTFQGGSKPGPKSEPYIIQPGGKS